MPEKTLAREMLRFFSASQRDLMFAVHALDYRRGDLGLFERRIGSFGIDKDGAAMPVGCVDVLEIVVGIVENDDIIGCGEFGKRDLAFGIANARIVGLDE